MSLIAQLIFIIKKQKTFTQAALFLEHSDQKPPLAYLNRGGIKLIATA
jgi:hypothetical protein